MARGVLGGNSTPVHITGSDVSDVDAINVQITSPSGGEIYDDLTGAMLSIDTAHHEVHEGHSFVASTYNSAVVNSASLILLITTTSKPPHMVFRCAAGGDATVTFYEGVTTITDGTVVAVVNLSRMSTEVSSVTAHHTPNTSGLGTTLDTQFLAGGTGPSQSSGSEVRRNTEWILRTNTKYQITVTNISGNNQPVSINIEFYTL